MGRKPLIVAHAGCEGTPPGSLESAVAGYEAGADLVEVDLRVTKDGVVVLRHDAEVLADGRAVPISSMDYATLASLDRAGRLGVNEDGPLTRLAEVIELARRRGGRLNLDIKEDAAVAPALELVRAAEMESALIFTGCEAERARLVRQSCPDAQVLLNLSDDEYELARRDYSRFVRAICESAVRTGCCGLNVHFAVLSEELLDRAAYRFLPVSVWTVDEPSDQKRAIDFGVHSITTRRVGALVRLVRGGLSRSRNSSS